MKLLAQAWMASVFLTIYGFIIYTTGWIGLAFTAVLFLTAASMMYLIFW